MALELYGVPTSSSTRRVLTTIFEKDITDFNLIPVDPSKADNKKPEYLAMQPFGVIPVLKDGDVTVFGQCLPLNLFNIESVLQAQVLRCDKFGSLQNLFVKACLKIQ